MSTPRILYWTHNSGTPAYPLLFSQKKRELREAPVFKHMMNSII